MKKIFFYILLCIAYFFLYDAINDPDIAAQSLPQAGFSAQLPVPIHGHSGPTDGGTLSPAYTTVYSSGGTTPISAGTFTAIPWDSEIYDPLQMHDPVSNNTKIYVPAGYSKATVACQSGVSWTGTIGTSAKMVIIITKNGLNVVSKSFYMPNNANQYQQSVGPIYISVSSGDYVQCVFQNLDAVQSIDINGSATTSYFYIQYFR